MSRRYRALATDYDDTLAEKGRIAPEAVRALEKLREAGFHLILVTGRELPDLREVAPDLALFHRVVAENGALFHHPLTLETRRLAGPPDDEFLDALRKRGIGPLSIGDIVVAAPRPFEEEIREIIESLDRNLHAISNDDSVMILPRGLDKMTGLQLALDELGLPAEDVVAIGNAENDYAFLERCGFPVAVANAVPELKKAARLVTQGERGEGVIELAEMLLETGGRLGTRTPDPFGVNEVL